ncbi:hypothetical protein Tco_0647802, partial [Tanacetum coccineum]
DDDGGVDEVAVVRIVAGVDGVVWLMIREVDDGCRGDDGGIHRFGFLNILIGIEEVTGSFSPLEIDLGTSMALPHSLEKLPEYFSVKIQRISLTRFPAQSVGSSNTNELDSPCLHVLNTRMSQSRQHDMSESDSYYLFDLVVNSFTGTTRYPVDTSLIHIESRKSPTTELFEVDSGRISIRHSE